MRGSTRSRYTEGLNEAAFGLVKKGTILRPEKTPTTLVDRIGNGIVGSMRSCVASRLPSVAKAAWLLFCNSMLICRPMRSFEATAVTTYGGCRLSGKPSDCALNRAIVYRGVFEPTLSAMIWKIVGPGDVCLDAGANAGYFTLLFARRVGPTGKVIAIEAAPGNVARLTRNVELNGFTDRVTIVGAACSDAPGQVTFHLYPKNDMCCRLERPRMNEVDYWLLGRQWTPVSVRADRLSAFAGDDAPRISFVKLDVEGVEHRVVDEILQAFTHPRLCVAVEAKAPHIRDTLEPFARAGFSAYDLQNDYQWLYTTAFKPSVPATFEALYKRRVMVDVLLSRQPLPAAATG